MTVFTDGSFWACALWSLIASALAATLIEGAQLLGRTRLSMPLLVGTVITEARRPAMIWGYVLYFAGGWIVGFVYGAILSEWPGYSPWFYAFWGIVIGIVHGLFLIGVVLPALPNLHPRLVSDYDAPGRRIGIEPPGAFGLNYGKETPLYTVAAQALFGLVLGVGLGPFLGGQM